jgi:hypothetical protein
VEVTEALVVEAQVAAQLDPIKFEEVTVHQIPAAAAAAMALQQLATEVKES